MSILPMETTQLPGKEAAILTAALKCFGERGFHGTSMPDIAKSAKVAIGTIYHYFKNKEVLVNRLYLHIRQEELKRLLNGFPFQASVTEQFAYYWRTVINFAIDYPEAFDFVEFHFHSPYLNDECRRVENTFLDIARAAFDTARQQGIVKNVATEMLFSMMHGSLLGLVRAMRTDHLTLSEEDIEQSGQMALQMLQS